MNIILDTHIALWAIADHSKLSKKAKEYLLDSGNNIYYSAVSVMEISIKRKGKSNNIEFTPEEFVQYCEAAGYVRLPLLSTHVIAEETLKWSGDGDEHRDPFDRLLLAQAKAEKYSLMTHDHMIPLFDEKGIIGV